MGRRETSRATVVGYLVVLLGVAGWVLGCFLPLYRIADFGGDSITLYRQVAFGSIGIKLGGALFLFGGIAAIEVISMIGIIRHHRRSATVLAGAVIAWILTSTGVLISVGSAFSRPPGWSLAVGYWCLWASVACVLAGTVIVLTSSRRPDAETGGVAQLDERSDTP
jgi:hypothetical protein